MPSVCKNYELGISSAGTAQTLFPARKSTPGSKAAHRGPFPSQPLCKINSTGISSHVI